jgi:predicted ArsR family transcriptional regulator
MWAIRQQLSDGGFESTAEIRHTGVVNIAAPARDGAQIRPRESGTRDAVVQLLLSRGPITAAALAERLALSAAGVRRHLDALESEGAVTSRLQATFNPRGRGRPARVYLLTETGRSRLPHAYDDLAIEALNFLADQGGPEAVQAFARNRAERIVAGRQQELDAATDLTGKIEVLASALTDAGFAASIEKIGNGEQLCQHHCPVAHVAEQFPQLCEAEMTVFTTALGTYAQRLATIARGDSFCTTFVPNIHRTAQHDKLHLTDITTK